MMFCILLSLTGCRLLRGSKVRGGGRPTPRTRALNPTPYFQVLSQRVASLEDGVAVGNKAAKDEQEGYDAGVKTIAAEEKKIVDDIAEAQKVRTPWTMQAAQDPPRRATACPGRKRATPCCV